MKKLTHQIFLTFVLLLAFLSSFSQKKSALVSGKVLDENENTLAHVSVVILGRQSGVSTNDTGYFHMRVPADQAFVLVFSYTGYKTEQKNFLLSENENETIILRMERGANVLREVVVTDQRDRREAGLIKPNPKSVINMPSPVMG